jgi:hypothetical protein
MSLSPNATVSDMTKPDDIEPTSAPKVRKREGRPQFAKTIRNVPSLTRSRLLRFARPARGVLATLGPLGAALWALYPVTIVMLIIGFLFAGAGST